MNKIIIINNCAICPKKLWAGDKRVCSANDYMMIKVPVNDIPDWCPLENAPNTALETDQKLPKKG